MGEEGSVTRWLLVLLLGLDCLLRPASAQAGKADPIDAKTVAAWEKLGARLGGVLKDKDRFPTFRVTTRASSQGLPGFKFYRLPGGKLPRLPRSASRSPSILAPLR
jgi:hypothetical protein